MARKKKNKELKLHPITSFIILILGTILLSAILSIFNISASYDSVNIKNNELEQTIITITNMLSSDGIKFIISNASKNFASLTTLSTVIITLMGIGVAEETGLIQTIMKKKNFVTYIRRFTLSNSLYFTLLFKISYICVML